MNGYLNRPEATAEVMRDGWFRSGDLGRRDEDGFYYIVDRSKDMIIRGGFNVYPREVEEVLITHPDVSLAAVVGVPHESHGEEIKAFVIRNDGATVTEDELVAWAKEQMAAYKYPRIVDLRRLAADDRHRQDPQARAGLSSGADRPVSGRRRDASRPPCQRAATWNAACSASTCSGSNCRPPQRGAARTAAPRPGGPLRAEQGISADDDRAGGTPRSSSGLTRAPGGTARSDRLHPDPGERVSDV